jgi:hypothetical protein
VVAVVVVLEVVVVAMVVKVKEVQRAQSFAPQTCSSRRDCTKRCPTSVCGVSGG